MPNRIFNDDPWFEPKRYGYGSGFPIAWQGWVLLGAFIVATLGFGMLIEQGQQVIGIVGITLFTVLFIVLVKRHTRGGWRWRNGG